MRKIWAFIWHQKKYYFRLHPGGWDCDRQRAFNLSVWDPWLEKVLTILLILPSTMRGSNFLASTCPVQPCACAFVALYLCALHNGYTQAYWKIMQHTHMHKAVTRCIEVKRLLSHRRQLEYICGVGFWWKICHLGYVQNMAWPCFVHTLPLMPKYLNYNNWKHVGGSIRLCSKFLTTVAFKLFKISNSSESQTDKPFGTLLFPNVIIIKSHSNLG